MNVFGLSITRASSKAAPASLSTVSTRGGWFNLVREGFSGAWQRNIEWRAEDVLSYPPVFACVTLIAADIAKMPIRLMARQGSVWVETENNAYSPVLRKPNHYQIPIQFYQNWMISKLIHGNTFVLKERDNRGVVSGLYILDPTLVRPMVASDSSVWYSLSADNLAGIEQTVVVSASEVMHDLMGPLYHPLCGTAPLSACGLAATQGIRIQNNSTNFFQNGAQPGGILSMAGALEQADVRAIQQNWEEQFSGQNNGRVAVLGNGLTYTPMAMKATDSQTVEQLKWSAEAVCTAFHVPPYMVGVGPSPTYTNIEALQLQYYQQCLQVHVESIEWLIDTGLGLGSELSIEFDLDALMRMDTPTRVKAAHDAVNGGGMTFNEARKRFHGLGPVEGGNTVLSQQQNYSLAALAKRDAQPDPFGTAPAPAAPVADDTDEDDPDDEARQAEDLMVKALAAGMRAA